jgi:hypothetical protein
MTTSIKMLLFFLTQCTSCVIFSGERPGSIFNQLWNTGELTAIELALAKYPVIPFQNNNIL